MGRCVALQLLLLAAAAACAAGAGGAGDDAGSGAFVKPAFVDEPAHAAFLLEFKASHPARQSPRRESGLSHGLHDRAMLFFRSLDADHDKLITRRDAAASLPKLQRFVPGISLREFSAFIEAADKNGDRALDHNEFVNAFAEGLAGVQQPQSSPLLLETSVSLATQSQASRIEHRRALRVGFVGSAVSAVGNFIGNKVGELGRHLSGKLDTSQDSCVMCQYIMERCEVNVRMSGVIQSMSAAQDSGAMVETSSQVRAHQMPIDMSDAQGAEAIGGTHEGTRYRRLVERQKYNEIYRVVDLTLDDVCESGMPTNFYGYCKNIYQTQSDVVDGLRYQYRPADICFRIGMCDKKSYIAQGVHSRYKTE